MWALWGPIREGEPQPTGGLLQAVKGEEDEEEGKGEKEEAEVTGGVKRRAEEDVEEEAGVDARDTGMVVVCRARRVSTAKPGLEGLGAATTVDSEAQDSEEEREPRRAGPPWLGGGGEGREDLGTCDDSPTNPGALAAGKSKGGWLKDSIPFGANEYSPPGK